MKYFLISNFKSNFYRYLLVLVQTSFAILTIGLTACDESPTTKNVSPVTNNSSSPTDDVSPYFPTQKNAKVMYILRTEGILIVNDGYLRLNGYLLIWPSGFSLGMNNSEIIVLDRDKIEVARVGNVIVMGGGLADKRITEGFIDGKLPDGAEGPYWIVGQIVSSKSQQ